MITEHSGVKMYQIRGTKHVTFNTGMFAGTTVSQVPTFYLDPNLQGITSEEAAVELAKYICGEGVYSATLVEI
jgi:hypothetical protein